MVHVHRVYLVERVATVQLWRLGTRAELLASGCVSDRDVCVWAGAGGFAGGVGGEVAEGGGDKSGRTM